MPLDRRQFVAGLGGAGLVYVLGGCSRAVEPIAEVSARAVPRPHIPGIDFREWLHIGADGTVSVFSSRNELGQGITTVLYDLVTQGLEIEREQVRVVLGDTDLCPNDGPTTGSAATRHVAWAFWEACGEIRRDLVRVAADRLGCGVEELTYRSGRVEGIENRELSLAIGELAEEGRVLRLAAGSQEHRDPEIEARPYVDRGHRSVLGEAIVTGTQIYTGDLFPEGCLYGGLLLPEYHRGMTRVLEAETLAARERPGVVVVQEEFKSVVAVADSYSSVQRALETVQARWKKPRRPRELDNESEIRDKRKFVKVVEEAGDPDRALAVCDLTLKDSYITQYASQVPIETKTAVADSTGERVVIHMGTQSPFQVRFGTSEAMGVAAERVHVASVPAGGAFGSRTSHKVGNQAARMSQLAGAPVKLVYSREHEFQMGGRYKESVVVDIESGISSDGKILARRIDLHRDEGFGTENVYDIPNVRTRLYRSKMPTRHATMRGTSYTQSVFAMESHTDSLAHAAGIDPLELRRKNVRHEAFVPLLDKCAEMVGYGKSRPADHGVGLALCNHGGSQFGVVGAEVSVDRQSGRVTVERLCGAFDIGKVINRNLTHMGVKGAMIWGLGFAMTEEVKIDGHHCFTRGLGDYRIPRFSDIPPIEIAFLANHDPERPRGCGEMPLVPTPPAICNAVFDAIGVRFLTLPLTPERVKAGLQNLARIA